MTDIVNRLREVAEIETGLLYSRRQMLKDAADEIVRLRANVDYLLMEQEGSDNAKDDLAEILSAFEPRWKHMRIAAVRIKEERDSLKALCDEMAKALEPFSEMAGEMFARNWNANAISIALDNPDGSHRVIAGDFFAARQVLSAYRKEKEVGNG